MDFLDDEACDSDEESILVSSPQSKENQRPPKRRRMNKSYPNFSDGESGSGSDDYDLPSNDYNDDAGEDERRRSPKSKYDGLMHVPRYAEPQPDTFVTQLSQTFSSPSRIRGPRWKKRPAVLSPAPSPRRATRVFDQDVSYSSLAPVQLNPGKNDEVRSPPSLQGGDEFDDDDPELLEAFVASSMETEETRQIFNPSSTQNLGVQTSRPANPASTNLRQTTLFGISTTQRDSSSTQRARVHNWPLATRNEPPTHHKTNPAAMKTWIYPTNLGKIRDYQFNIVHKGLFHNLLVALPTGLGKTFIAATVMLNWYRWTTNAQIIFVAPTKPLVSQQIDACFNIVGIPRSDTTMLTGEVSPGVRAEEWQEKRVFFMTPQTLINDLKNGMCDPKRVVLLVVDEAHKATGNYAYVEVVRFLRRFNSSFRVLALTATPGASVEAVQKVIDGLDIARVEIRTEESLDIRDFVHSRNTEVELFDNSEEVSMCLSLFAGAVGPVLNKLVSQNAWWGKDPTMVTLYGLKMARDQWAKSEVGRAASFGLKGMINSAFNVLMSLAHNLELLKYHGIGPFYHKMKVFADDASGNNKQARQIIDSEDFKKLMNRLRGWVNSPDFVGHPKLSYLNRVVLNHFIDAGDGQGLAGNNGPSNTRIMVFSHYRDSAEEICRVLNRHGPMVRAHVFVGQSGTKGSEGMDQKTQLDIIKKFKSGIYNTLVATSIGEEGLDIGEVDLIVCYDCSKSPIRMLQRMGRTGRKRAGNIVLLLMRGKEETDYMKAKDNYLKMQEIIESGKDFTFHDDRSPRIVPREIVPVVDKCIVEIPIENTQAEPSDPRKRRARNPKKPPKKFHMPDGVETGFAFLGGRKTANKTVEPQPPLIDIETVGLSPLDNIVLTPEDEAQLDQRYARIAGDNPQYIQQVHLEAFPESIHKSNKTSLIGHSRSTMALIKGLKRVRKAGSNYSRPSEEDIVKNSQIEQDLPVEGQTTLSQGITSRNLQTERHKTTKGHCSSEAAKPNEQPDYNMAIECQSNDETDEEHFPPFNASKSAAKKVEEPFFISQKSMQDGTSEDELPEVGLLFNKRSASAQQRGGKVVRPKTDSRVSRRVIDSDDEDD